MRYFSLKSFPLMILFFVPDAIGCYHDHEPNLFDKFAVCTQKNRVLFPADKTVIYSRNIVLRIDDIETPRLIHFGFSVDNDATPSHPQQMRSLLHFPNCGALLSEFDHFIITHMDQSSLFLKPTPNDILDWQRTLTTLSNLPKQMVDEYYKTEEIKQKHAPLIEREIEYRIEANNARREALSNFYYSTTSQELTLPFLINPFTGKGILKIHAKVEPITFETNNDRQQFLHIQTAPNDFNALDRTLMNWFIYMMRAQYYRIMDGAIPLMYQ